MPQLLDLVDLVPGDVLAQALMAVAAEPDHGRDLGEPAGDVAHERQELAAVDAQRQLGDARVVARSVERRRGQGASLPGRSWRTEIAPPPPGAR